MAKIVKFHEKGGPEVLKLEEVTLLSVAENDVRFRVHAIGLNRAESMYRKGAYLQDYTWPSRVGYEASGVVEAIGKNVTGFAPGDAVSVVPGSFSMASYGTYGEVADMPANRLARNPDWLLHTDAAAPWIQYGTAYVGIVEIANKVWSVETGDCKDVPSGSNRRVAPVPRIEPADWQDRSYRLNQLLIKQEKYQWHLKYGLSLAHRRASEWS